MTRAASLLLRVVGLALVLVAAMGFVLVGDGGAWTAHTSVAAGRTAVLVEPAVASVLGPSVRVRVTPEAEDEVPMFIGRGRSDDLAAYLQGQDVVRVVGLDTSRRLALREGAPPAPASSGSSSAGSTGRWQPMAVDLWQQVSGPQARELVWRPTPGASSILVAHEDGSPLPGIEVTVTWTDGRWLWYPAAALLLGVALIVGGFALIGALPFSSSRLRAGQVRRSRTAPAAASAVADEGHSPPPQPADDAGPALVPDDEPVTVPAPTMDGDGGAGSPAVSEALLTRRAARGRRRKETAWQRATAKARPRSGGRR